MMPMLIADAPSKKRRRLKIEDVEGGVKRIQSVTIHDR